jgi:hypothetical protein
MCPFMCGSTFTKRKNASKHARLAICAKAKELTPEERASLLARCVQPVKPRDICEICGITLEGRGHLPKHLASAAHLAKLEESTVAVMRRTQVTCLCGSTYESGRVKRHIRTMKHKIWKEMKDKADEANSKKELDMIAAQDMKEKYIDLADGTNFQRFRLFDESKVKFVDALEAELYLEEPSHDIDVSSEEEEVAASVAKIQKRLAFAIPKLIQKREAKKKAHARKLELRRTRNRMAFDGSINKAWGRALTFNVVLTSCLPYIILVKKEGSEEQAQGKANFKEGEGVYNLYKTTCKIMDRSCKEPIFLHCFSRSIDGVPPALPVNQYAVLSVDNARVCRGKHCNYLAVNDKSSWGVTSLNREMIAKHGYDFLVNFERMDDMILLGFELMKALLEPPLAPKLVDSFDPSPEEIDDIFESIERADADDELSRIIRSKAADKIKYEAKLIYSDYKAGKFDAKNCKMKLSRLH